MNQDSIVLIAIGSFLLIGLITDVIAKKTSIPRVTLLVCVGVVLGPQVLGVIPEIVEQQFDWLTSIALVMVGFLLGGKLTSDTFLRLGAPLLWISLSEALTTAVLITLALVLIGIDWKLALVLGCIGAATAAEVAFQSVIEVGANNRFSNLLLGIVALDDVWSLIIFSVGIALAAAGTGFESFIDAGKELVGGIALGIGLGVPAAYITGRLKPGEPVLIEALAVVFICSGLAQWLEVSFLLAAISMGAVIANIAKHHEQPFHAIENVEWPFLLLFFILAGALLELDSISVIAVATGVYTLARIIGKWSGAFAGASFSGSDVKTKKWIGVALMPQAGASIGMALVAGQFLPEYEQILLQIVIASTLIFELLGPILTSIALKRNS